MSEGIRHWFSSTTGTCVFRASNMPQNPSNTTPALAYILQMSKKKKAEVSIPKKQKQKTVSFSNSGWRNDKRNVEMPHTM